MKTKSKLQTVQPEDRAIQGWNPSAALDSNTAGWSGCNKPRWPASCGIDPKAKNPRGFGGLVPHPNNIQPKTEFAKQLTAADRSIAYSTSPTFQLTLNQDNITPATKAAPVRAGQFEALPQLFL